MWVNLSLSERGSIGCGVDRCIDGDVGGNVGRCVSCDISSSIGANVGSDVLLGGRELNGLFGCISSSVFRDILGGVG